MKWTTLLRAKSWLILPLLAFIVSVPFFLTLALTGADSGGTRDTKIKHHRIVFQVNSDDPATMKHAIANAVNATNYYKEKNETTEIEIVAYGPGLHMFRTDTSPVKDLLQYLRANIPGIAFTACGNTQKIMENREGHPLSFVEGAKVVPAGIVRVIELQEAGWAYVRP